jgi:hypothetical protein
LVEGLGRYARYVTLSHCWGNAKPVQTVRQNLSQRQANITFAELPKTFQHAVELCQQLGIDYLWIDTLCIIQDSKDDWEIQSGEMGSIYYNSTLTVAAEDAFDSDGGMLLPADPHTTVSLSQDFCNNRGQAYLRPSSWYPGHHTNWNMNMRERPDGPPRCALGRRGWAYQERVLARRVIHFARGSFYWMCGEYGWWQGGVCRPSYGLPRRDFDLLRKVTQNKFHLVKDNTNDQRTDSEYDQTELRDQEDGVSNDFSQRLCYIGTPFPRSMCAPPICFAFHDEQPGHIVPAVTLDRATGQDMFDFVDHAARFSIYHTWYTMIYEYSRRKLTFESDKLPALAGIASRIQVITHDQYLAGHWRKELARSLFWRVNSFYLPSISEPCRTGSYRAPTWGWASVNGYINWDMPDTTFVEYVPESFETLDASVQVQGQNPFGEVTAGSIKMKARTIEAIWDSAKVGWVVDPTYTSRCEYLSSMAGSLEFLNTEAGVVGRWAYDDLVNGVLPGPELTSDTPHDHLVARCIVPYQKRLADTPQDPYVLDDLWQRGSLIPEHVMLVKGSYALIGFDVLVLARTGMAENEYRRIGHGHMRDWDESVGEQRIITIV